jgi:hypothetical protein
MNSTFSGKHRNYSKPGDRVYISTSSSLLLLRIIKTAEYKMITEGDKITEKKLHQWI